MKWIGIAMIYIGFYSLIGAAVYWTESAIPLFALLFTPSFSTDDCEKKHKNNSST